MEILSLSVIQTTMQLALDAAQDAFDQNEVPIGAVVTDHAGLVLATAYNQTRTACDPTAHAEILALRQAAQIQKNYRLPNCLLFCTVEPCWMCVGAICEARIQAVYYGAASPKTGALTDVAEKLYWPKLLHQPKVYTGYCAEQAEQLLQDFFRAKRINISI